MTATNSDVNNGWRFGRELVAPGTVAASGANRYIPELVMDPPARVTSSQVVKEQGGKSTIATRHNMDYITSKLSGVLSYQSIIYILNNILGAASVSTPSGGVNIAQRTYEIPTGGPNTPITWSGQYGQDGGTGMQFLYMLLSGMTLHGMRDGSVTVECPFFAQASTEDVTMTASPTRLLSMPVIGAHWNVYRDPTWATIGTTLLARVREWTLALTNYYAPHWVGNRTYGRTYGLHKELLPVEQLTIGIEKDATGSAMIADMRNDAPEFFQIQCSGEPVDNYQLITITGTPTGGTFTLSYEGATTGTIPYNATLAQITAALQALSTIGASGCTVAGSDGGPFTVTWAGQRTNDFTAMTLANNSLTGGTAPSVTIAGTVKSNVIVINASCLFNGDDPVTKNNDVIWNDYTFDLARDTVSGHKGQIFVATKANSDSI